MSSMRDELLGNAYGQVYLRQTGETSPAGDGKKLVMVVGIIAVDDESQFDEAQCSGVGHLTLSAQSLVVISCLNRSGASVFQTRKHMSNEERENECEREFYDYLATFPESQRNTIMESMRRNSSNSWAFWKAAWDSQQARIDSLMVTHCPDDMTTEQLTAYMESIISRDEP